MKVEIAKIISNGCGIGWAEGKTFFVPFTVHGETVKIKKFEKEKGHFRATDFDIITPSVSRRKPLCSHYMRCGGCSFQHISYPLQMEIKKEIFLELLKQNGLLIDVEPILLSAGETNLRTRAKVFIENGTPAFRAYHSNELIKFSNCPALNPEFQELIFEDAKKRNGDVQYEFSKFSKDLMPPMDRVRKVVNSKTVTIFRNSFFQSSEEGAEILCSLLTNEIKDLKPKTGYDLFCGSGLFSVFMAETGVAVTGMEIVTSAVEGFKENLKNKAEIEKADAYKIKNLQKKDIVVADPPREGLGIKLVDIIADSKTETVVYISCEPSKFARDTKRFLSKGYSLKKVFIIDLFPMTHHFEVFSVFKLSQDI
jgi:23S rRNA (uracil1939-C5)-methyltransferase